MIPTRVKRSSKKKKFRDNIKALQAQQDCVEYFNAVDRNDRDISDYSTSLRTNRYCYYLRIFFWALDRVIHTVYVVVVWLATEGVGPSELKRYCDRENGRRMFQIDLGIALIDYAIEREFEETSKHPSWVRQMDFVPCDCEK